MAGDLDRRSRQEVLVDLYSSWRAQHPGEHLIDCGLVDEAAYGSAAMRVVWVLKEAVDEKQTHGWSLPGYFLDVAEGRRPPSRTARPLGALTWGLLHGSASYAAAREHMGAGLRALGVTNLKKSGGPSSSRWSIIAKAANRTRELWMEELRVMDPDVVVCGGTFWHVGPRLCGDPSKAPRGSRYGFWRELGRVRLVVEAAHPASWANGRELAYANLKDAVSHGRGLVSTNG
jgi:hypothetical protein